MTARESTAAKATRLLAEGRLTVTFVGERTIHAYCRGDHDTYQLGFDPEHDAWYCSCPATVYECSHVLALILVSPPSIRPLAARVVEEVSAG